MRESSVKFLFISVQKTMDVIGLKCLHYQLLANSFESSILFVPALNPDEDSLDEIGKFVEDMAPDIIGFSVMTIDFNPAALVTSYLKQHSPDIPVIWGGHHPTVAPESCVEHCDYVLMGEADEAILKIANAIKKNQGLENVPGIYFIKDGEIIKNELPPVENIDSLLTHQHVPQNSYVFMNNEINPLDDSLSNEFDRFAGRIYNILTSRGCPLSCTFCCNSYLKNINGTDKLRRRSVTNFIDEIEDAIKQRPEIAYINFLDDFFMIGAEKDYWKDFSSQYKERVNKPFFTKPIPSFVTKENITGLKKAGLTWVGLGLQASDRINEEVFDRPSFASHFLDSARMCDNENIAVYYDLITDNPFETKQDKIDTLRVLRDAPKPCLLSVYSLTYFPGTKLYDKVHKEKLQGASEDARESDLILHDESIYNYLVRLAAHLNPKMSEKIISMYEKDQEHTLEFKIRFYALRLFTLGFREPLNYFLTIKRSQRGSWPKTLKALPIFFWEGFRRYFSQFQFNFIRKKLSYVTPIKVKKPQPVFVNRPKVTSSEDPNKTAVLNEFR